ncbi:pseudouridine synthase [Floridanema aerugineum]|jgi:23S rRNA pseudouridine2605 synthase|uniref:Pseudouridine synthase n=1 Tax=Floridaenema aerugineum BLCC-F46 TaxID=3153654 RepID=A0ABV4XF29_9CYAN
MERLQKLLSQWGIASRRHAEEMIQAGRVRVNGEIAHLGQKADPLSDRIAVDDKLIKSTNRPQQIYLLLNKPAGTVSTCSDPQGRPTVLHLLPASLQRGQGIYPVGRLDADSTGALLLTNDGDLAFRLTHPRHSMPKTYQVWVEGQPPENILQMWREGVILEGKKTLPCQIRVLETGSKGDHTLLEVILKEGRNRQIRRVAEQLGYPVIQLHRTAIGPIQLQLPKQRLLPGEYRHLTDVEINFLQSR